MTPCKRLYAAVFTEQMVPGFGAELVIRHPPSPASWRKASGLTITPHHRVLVQNMQLHLVVPALRSTSAS